MYSACTCFCRSRFKSIFKRWTFASGVKDEEEHVRILPDWCHTNDFQKEAQSEAQSLNGYQSHTAGDRAHTRRKKIYIYILRGVGVDLASTRLLSSENGWSTTCLSNVLRFTQCSQEFPLDFTSHRTHNDTRGMGRHGSTFWGHIHNIIISHLVER